MTEPFLGEIQIFAGNFAPRGWLLCQGQLLGISQFTALFSLLGTTYGGNGTSTFALPDLRGRAPLSMGTGPGLTTYVEGEATGTETVTLLQSEMPAHTHALNASPARGDRSNANNASLAAARDSIYATTAPNAVLNSASVSLSGGAQPHQNMQPYLALTFIIATQGIFPARN